MRARVQVLFKVHVNFKSSFIIFRCFIGKSIRAGIQVLFKVHVNFESPIPCFGDLKLTWINQYLPMSDALRYTGIFFT